MSKYFLKNTEDPEMIALWSRQKDGKKYLWCVMHRDAFPSFEKGINRSIDITITLHHEIDPTECPYCGYARFTDRGNNVYECGLCSKQWEHGGE
jgi:hypothetical protein